MGELIRKVAEAPAIALEKTVEAAESAAHALVEQRSLKQAGEFWKMLGPGLTTGAADDDPSGIATYSQAGAIYGFQLLWLAVFTFPLMATVQEMCARIGLVTGRGLASNIRRQFPPQVLVITTTFLLAANTFNIGADLGAMAKAVQLLVPHASYIWLIVLFATGSVLLQVFTAYERFAKYLKWLALILFSYVVSALLAQPNWSEILKATLIPRIDGSKDQIILITAILGTTISPYLFFWQTSQEVEGQISEGNTTVAQRQHISSSSIKSMRIDVWSGMFLSNVAMFFIIASAASVLFVHGVGTTITTAADAAAALRPFAGNAAYLLFAVGIIGTGLLAIPVLAGSSSYAIAESFRWHAGLHRTLKDAYGFYGVIIISMAVGMLLNFIGLDPIKALIYSAVANGVVAPVILTLIVLLSSNRHIMGKNRNAPLVTWSGWALVALMFVAGVAAVYSLIHG